MSAADRQKFQQYRDQFTNVSGDEADRLAIAFVNDSNNPGVPSERLDLIRQGPAAQGAGDPDAVISDFGIDKVVYGAEQAYLSGGRTEAYFDPQYGYVYPGQVVGGGDGVGGVIGYALDQASIGGALDLQAPQLSPIGQGLRTAAPVLAPVGEATAKIGQYIDGDPVLKFATFAVGAAISPVQTLLTAAIEPTPVGRYVTNLTEEGYQAYNGFIQDAGQFSAPEAQAVGAGAFGVSSLILLGAGALAKVGRVIGGPYSRVKGIPGNQAHHIPADSASPLPKGQGPAISMEREDHMQTASYGSSKEAEAYRQQQRDLINVGDFRGAQQLDFNDIRLRVGNPEHQPRPTMDHHPCRPPPPAPQSSSRELALKALRKSA
jgi:hypothetical protein